MSTGISRSAYLLKRLFRFFKYSDERKRFFRERKIIRQQNTFINKYDRNTKKLIVFLVPGADRKTGRDTISGGVTSLVSLCQESALLKSLHNAEVLMTVFPREYLLLKHTNFDNDTQVFRFEQLPRYFTNVNEIIIHIPEYLITHFEKNLFKFEISWLLTIKTVHINVINANILLMPPPEAVHTLSSIANKITITAAHTRYCTPVYRNLYNYPLHKFSAWISPEQYNFVKYEDKKDKIVVSPDQHPDREQILNKLRQSKLEVNVLQNLSYTEFKREIGEAKWALTFGEGLDGYILEPIFSGCIAFAVYNEDFFTEDFKNTSGIYNSYDDLQSSIMKDIEMLDNAESYKAFQKAQFDLCAMHYNFNKYKENIRLFYEEKYTLA